MAKKPKIKVFRQSRACYGIDERAFLNPVTRWHCKNLPYPKQVDVSYKRLYWLQMPVQQIKRLLFTALPGGNRNNNGTFNNIGNNGNWWSATENNTNNAWNRNMNYNNSNVNRNNNNKELGFSVRCLRDLKENTATGIISPWFL
jgi:ribosomal protein L28